MISSHLPPCINCSDDVLEYHMRDLSSLLRGARCHSLMLGIDANVQLLRRHQEVGLIGQATCHTSSSPASYVHVPATVCSVSEMSSFNAKFSKLFEHVRAMPCSPSPSVAGRSTRRDKSVRRQIEAPHEKCLPTLILVEATTMQILVEAATM